MDLAVSWNVPARRVLALAQVAAIERGLCGSLPQRCAAAASDGGLVSVRRLLDFLQNHLDSMEPVLIRGGAPLWTDKNRAKYNRDQLRYRSDLTDDEWAYVEPLIPPAKRGGGKRRTDMRAVMNGVMYILSTGCQWRYIPKDFPPRSTLHDYFTWWICDGTLNRIHHALYVECREKMEREASPTACIIDSQSVKSAEKMLWGERRGQCHHRRSGDRAWRRALAVEEARGR